VKINFHTIHLIDEISIKNRFNDKVFFCYLYYINRKGVIALITYKNLYGSDGMMTARFSGSQKKQQKGLRTMELMQWNAEKYHEHCGRVTEHGSKLVDILRGMPCVTVLDLGCGTGVLTGEIAEFAREVIGVDASPAMIDKAKAAYPGLKFFVTDALSIGTEWENCFDVVFSNAVLHFIREQDALLGNVCRVLMKNGALVCEFGAAGNIAGLLGAVERACVNRGKAYSLRFYYPSEDEYRLLLEKHGFFVESMVTYDLDTRLTEGESGLRNWIEQIFCVEMGWFEAKERGEVLGEIENALRHALWDGTCWHLDNKRLRVVARKKDTSTFLEEK